VNQADLEALVDQYRAGLETEIGLLLRLEQLATQQRQASTANDIDTLNRISDARDRLTAALVAVEEQLRRLRQRFVESRAQARTVPGYEEAVSRHQEAIDIVTRIVNTDEASLEALNAAELARRDAVRALAHGETTLAAYRKVASLGSAAMLVDRKG
jgi:hypothetical protein